MEEEGGKKTREGFSEKTPEETNITHGVRSLACTTTRRKQKTSGMKIKTTCKDIPSASEGTSVELDHFANGRTLRRGEMKSKKENNLSSSYPVPLVDKPVS